MLTIYDHISANRRKTAVIVLLFPLVFCALMYLTIFAIVYFTHDPNASYPPFQAANILAIRISPFVFAVGFVWMAVSWFAGDSMMLVTAGAREIKRDDNPEVYSLVENTSIAAGLPMPRVFIMPDDSLNAFATGRSPEHSAVILTTRGIVKKLNRSELEGVVAHEMAHIGNRDVRNMMLVITGVGIITLTGELMFRFGIRMRGKKSPGPIIALLGIVLMIYGMFLAPLIMYALSRRREYQADATGALITRNPDALASALAKISVDSRVEALDSVALMSAACISHAGDEKSSFTSFFSELYSTHPPVEKRIQALNEMSGNAAG